MSVELENLIAKRFIQRTDVKAVQFTSGKYSPDYQLKNRDTGQPDPGRHGPLGFQRHHLTAHLAGRATYGHYVLDANDLCKVITFDVDLVDTEFDGSWYSFEEDRVYNQVNPRVLWHDKRFLGARIWYKYQMKMLATKLCAGVQTTLGIKTAAAYSGNKGVHVYAFMTTPGLAKYVHEGAQLVLEALGEFEPIKGNHIFRHTNPDPIQGFQNFTVEVYPKQESLEGKTLGNLVRLPLGRNLKWHDPTFFIDLTTPMAEMKPHPDPVRLLEEGNPFA